MNVLGCSRFHLRSAKVFWSPNPLEKAASLPKTKCVLVPIMQVFTPCQEWGWQSIQGQQWEGARGAGGDLAREEGCCLHWVCCKPMICHWL